MANVIIDNIKTQGGKVKSYVSWCGGLPAPEFSHVPLRYKFSWSPNGVLLAALSSSKYLLDGKIINRDEGTNYHYPLPISFLSELGLVGVPNRNSLNYKVQYGLYDAFTVLRGTLRYQGFSEVIVAFQKLGLLDTQPSSILTANDHINWRQVICKMLNLDYLNVTDALLRQNLFQFVGENGNVLSAFVELGLLNESSIVHSNKSLLDGLARHLTLKLSYSEDEHDMVVMRHEIISEIKGVKEKHEIDFVLYGDDINGYSAMAKSVGYTCAIAVRTMLDQGFDKKSGIITPITKDVYMPILAGLTLLGFTWNTNIVSLAGDV